MKYSSIFNRIFTAFRVIALASTLAVFVPAPARAADAAPATEEAKGPTKHSLMDDIKQGGVMMIPIVLCSVFTIYLIVDMYSRLSMKKLAPEEEVAKARQFFLAGDYVNCYQAMKAIPCAFNNCVKYGLSFVGKGKDQTETALLTEVGRENARLQNRINYLSVIGVCTPMIGLLGTVIGMKGAFAALGASGAADTSKLSEKIGEVLIATASGLFIAIPAFMFFYILRNRLAKQMHELEDTVMALYRNMPYDYFNGLEIGEEVTYAAVPNWIEDGAPARA